MESGAVSELPVMVEELCGGCVPVSKAWVRDGLKRSVANKFKTLRTQSRP